MEEKEQYIFINGRFVKVGGGSGGETVAKDSSEIVIDRVFLSTTANMPKYTKKLIVTTKPISQELIDLIKQNTGLVALRFNHIWRNRGRHAAFFDKVTDEHEHHYKTNQVKWSFPETLVNYLKEPEYWKNCLVHVYSRDLQKDRAGNTYIKLRINLGQFFRNTVFGKISYPEHQLGEGEYLLTQYAFSAPDGSEFSNLKSSSIIGPNEREVWEDKVGSKGLLNWFTTYANNKYLLCSSKLISAITNKHRNRSWGKHTLRFNEAADCSIDQIIFNMSGHIDEAVKIYNGHTINRSSEYGKKALLRKYNGEATFPLTTTYSDTSRQPEDNRSYGSFKNRNQFNSKLNFCILKPDWETSNYMYKAVFPVFEDKLVRAKFNIDYLIKPEWKDAQNNTIKPWTLNVDHINIKTSSIIDLSFSCFTEILDK